MDIEFLSRIQFALTSAFHFLYPPITIGLGAYIVILEWLWLKTDRQIFKDAAKFFLGLFALVFAVGVGTGIILVFQFGTNWPIYSNFVGDVFGSPLAIEAVVAFFMESTFLAVSLLAWDKIGRRAHFFSTFMVALGAHLSAVWIIVANSFMQTPAGFCLVKGGEILPPFYVPTSAEIAEVSCKITGFWDMVFNPSTVDRLLHVLSASWLAGGLLALGVCAWFILRGRDVQVFKPSLRVALYFSIASCFAMFFTGHTSARGIVHTQPEKFAAFEAHFNTQRNAPLYLWGWVDQKNETVKYSIAMPSILSYLAYGYTGAEVVGLKALPSAAFIKSANPNISDTDIAKVRKSYWAPVNITFQSFRLMVFAGTAMFGLLVVMAALDWRKKLFDTNSKIARLVLWVCVPSFILPLAASIFGWIAAEVGRQPWIVWHILKTKDAATTAATANEVLFSIILFSSLFVVVSAAFAAAFFAKIRKGITF